MKCLVIYIALFFCAVSASADLITLNGRVVDRQTNESLPGALVTIPDLKISVATDLDGRFAFSNVPDKGRFLVEARYIGYRTAILVVDFSLGSPIEFRLTPSTIEADEVVVTGTAFSTDNRRNSTSVETVSKDELLGTGSANLVDAISRVPGVAQITTGGGISKPVIRGLSYNRVLTLVDGAKQEGQQWGDEHGLEVDQFAADRVEVLRGAASLLYGSDALGGVINILEPLPAPEGKVQGEFLTNYQFNNGLTATSGMLQGNKGGFVWRGRGTYKSAFSYDAPGGRIANTGYDELNFSGQAGLNKGWGYLHLNGSTFSSKVGLPDFERNADGFFVDEDGNLISNGIMKDRSLLLPFQDIRHNKIALNSHILFGSGRLRTTIAYQNNQRRELEDDRSQPSLFFDLNTYSADFKYYINERNGWEPVFGMSAAKQRNRNRAEELLIPDYNSHETGLFGYLKKTWTSTTVNFGIRFDHRQIQGFEMEEEGNAKFSDFTNSFSNLNGAIGFTTEFSDKVNLRANLGTAFRAPNIAELSSDGVHEGSFRYEIGNDQLEPEKSYYGDAEVEYNDNTVSASFGVFNNYIDRYIYIRQLNGESTIIDGETMPVYRFVQDNANLSGIEASLTLHPAELVHFENSFSYTRALNRATDAPLPFIPAARVRNEIRLEPTFRSLKSSFLSLALNNTFRQNRVDDFETVTSGYTLVDIGLGTTIQFGSQDVRINVRATNVFNKAYYDHLSRFKPGRLDDTDPTLGFYNQGRNISIGVYLPF